MIYSLSSPVKRRWGTRYRTQAASRAAIGGHGAEPSPQHPSRAQAPPAPPPCNSRNYLRVGACRDTNDAPASRRLAQWEMEQHLKLGRPCP